MEKKYSYQENVIWFGKRQIILSEKVAEIIEFEKCKHSVRMSNMNKTEQNRKN